MIEEPSVTYPEKDLVRLARRDNNTKRPWLLVNPLQGKHIPCSPTTALSLFAQLASRLYCTYEGERLLIIGFAETATAIGAAVASYCPGTACYIPTTREVIDGGEYLFFSESHSHATEQKLVKNHLQTLLEQADRIVFAEDEVTTGNTILNAVAAIEREYASLSLKYGVVSILNGMTDEHFAAFHKRDISCTYLHHLKSDAHSHQLSGYEYDAALCCAPADGSAAVSDRIRIIDGYKNPRLGTDAKSFLSQCEAIARSVASHLSEEDLKGKKILVLGTEEFMFPPLYLGAYLESRRGCGSVRFHATTRSPILPSSAADYPISSRWSLRSVYDPKRPTFIYNLTGYDKVIIFHDSQSDALPGLEDLCSALKQAGCTDISIFEWSD